MAFTSKIGGGRGSSGGGRKSSKNKIPTAYKIGGPKDKSLKAKEKFQKSMMPKKQTRKGLEFITSRAGLTTINKNGKKVATITKAGNKGTVLRSNDEKTFTSTHFLGKKRKKPVEQNIKSFKNYSEAQKEASKIWGDK